MTAKSPRFSPWAYVNSLLHNHLFVTRQFLCELRWFFQIPVCNRCVIIVAWSCPSKVVDCHLEILREIHRILLMEAIQQEALLSDTGHRQYTSLLRPLPNRCCFHSYLLRVSHLQSSLCLQFHQ